MDPFANLPTEIVHDIVSYIYWDYGLYKLSSVSRIWRKSSLQALYENVYYSDEAHLRCFLRSIRANPELRPLVHHLSLDLCEQPNTDKLNLAILERTLDVSGLGISSASYDCATPLVIGENYSREDGAALADRLGRLLAGIDVSRKTPLSNLAWCSLDYTHLRDCPHRPEHCDHNGRWMTMFWRC
jgi:hypothetical protein